MRHFSLKTRHIALLLAVAIYMHKKIYKEELKSARGYLLSRLHNEDDVDKLMEYVKMKLGTYQENNDRWMKDRQKAFDLIIKNEDLYGFMSDIFSSDKSFDESEELFEKALRRQL